MILAGDIGGTKTWLALFEPLDGRLDISRQQQFSSRNYTNLHTVIDDFLHDKDRQQLTAACFGVAGAVIDGYCRTTNLPWDISQPGLQQHLSIQKVHLINDLAAMAFGMLYLPDEDFISLNAGKAQSGGNRAVIAAGTGLGEALLINDGPKFIPVATEGGHSDFAPQTRQQDELLSWLRARYPGHVSYERILCGNGIGHLYDFLCQNGFSPPAKFIENLPAHTDRAAAISICALQHQNTLCLETLRLFMEIYAAEAGNLALKSLALGGIYIGGGIAPKISPAINHEHFISHFAQKGRFENMLRCIPIKISGNSRTALIGAAYFAER